MSENAVDLANRTHWIFDMDGTLTVAAHDFDAIRSELGLLPRVPILEQLSALPAGEAAARFERLDRIECEIATRAEAQDGAGELLSALRARGAAVGILTRNSHHNAIKTLYTCRLADYFDTDNVLGREACSPKPSADGILRLLVRWGARPERAVMVGDYLFDLRAGRAAGVATVYFDPTGAFEWAAQADVSVESLRALRGLATESPGGR
jgi:HAD superfamily hydrolase (TIGR01509 family)